MIVIPFQKNIQKNSAAFNMCKMERRASLFLTQSITTQLNE
ncbi:10835_t:CDS:2 [Diversispora eburnea]|uniref:10835_t:CDS:1 n=1 Tax=Diversispora eburnea TaxID=1213867 RepID=A0A9N9AV43_9GLOM|nr:10835_t:CDS:2 [Diversispora eburnea]